MKKTQLWIIATVLCMVACSKASRDEVKGSEADKLIQKAYTAKNYSRLVGLADSLQQEGGLSEAEAYYWQGYASDRMMQHRMAEFFWKASMAAVDNSSEAEDVDVYARSASRLTNVLCTRGEYDGALKVAVPAAERLEQLHCDTTSDYTNLLIYIGCCQSRYGLSEESAKENFERAYKMHLSNIDQHHDDESFKNAIAGVINIAYNWNETSHYQDALIWIDRFGKLVSQYEQRIDASESYVDKQWARYNIYHAIALEGLNRKDEASTVYEDFRKTQYCHTPEGQILSNDYLVKAGRWAEAADSYASLDALLGAYHADYSLETLQEFVVKKYYVNMMAGRRDSAVAVSLRISESLDSAIAQSHRIEADELEVIRNKEEQKAAQQAEMSRQKQRYGLLALGLLIFALLVFAFFRYRSRHRLTKAHAELNTAYGQLEHETTERVRMESEQRIANEIQMSMIPREFPQHEDVDVYATLTPAQSVGGNFYDSFIRDEKLFFCIGDVSGTGVPASVAMALTKAQFRTVSALDNQPNGIVAALNRSLTGIGGTAPLVTLFAGVLDLPTGRLHYCNAGHHAPLLVGSGIGLLPVDDNAPLGQDADRDFTVQHTLIDPGTVIFLYTDGLVKAENQEHEQFSQRRMMRDALQALHGLDPNPRPFIERMTAALGRFIGDTPQGDDLTMMAIRYHKQASDVRLQRSLTLLNDISEVPRLRLFVENVCTALRFSSRATNSVNLALEETVVNIINYAYPEEGKGDIHVEARANDTELIFVVRDSGIPFDPTSAKMPDITLPLEERQIGGLGILLMRQSMDSINYERADIQNVLTLIKKLKPTK